MNSNIEDIGKSSQVVFATIGAFDGVHIGHQHLIRSMVENAHQEFAKALVVTFHPHPAVILKSIETPFYITSPSEKEKIFQLLGVDYIYNLEFSRKMSEMEPDQFVDMLLENYPIRQLWLGKDFALGRKRSGNLSVLSKIGREKGFTVINLPHVEDNDGKISSSQIRNWIATGEFLPTTKALNRYYSLDGKVISGDMRGRNLGFPTANLDVWEGKLLPIAGVYATWIEINNMIFPAVTNVGVRPTFENQDKRPRIEAHILNFDQDIYKKQVKLYFVEKIRLEMKFNSIDELVNQIKKDVKQAEEILNNVTKPTGLLT